MKIIITHYFYHSTEMNYTQNILRANEQVSSLTKVVHGTTGDIEATDPHLN